MYVFAIIALVAVLAAYKYVSAKYVDQPNQQADQIDMISKRINHLENQVTQLSHQLDELISITKASDNSDQENHD
jgi:transposase